MRTRLTVSLLFALLSFPVIAEPVSVTKVKWREDYKGFGSFSGLTLNADGTRFITVSDKGSYASGTLQRTDGQLTGVTLETHGPLLDPKGKPVRRYDIDAEGLTITPDGRLWVSFEANHRVWSYTDFALAARETAHHPDRKTLQNNSSLEALASDKQGRVYTIPERSGKLTRPFPAKRYDAGKWSHAFDIRRDGAFLVVGAEFGPDDKFYLLERDFSLLGFRTRIRRFSYDGKTLSDEETLMESPTGRYDNLEGIEVWRDAEGHIRITCISDDNYSIFQQTQFVEFVLAKDP